MIGRKLILKVSYGLVAAVVIVLVGLLVYQQRRIRQMSQIEKQEPLVAAIDTPPHPLPVAEGGREQLAEEVDALRYQLEASEEELDMAREDLGNKQGGFDKQEIIDNNKKMRENSTLMKMWRRNIENNLDTSYGVLFERLGLSDEKLQAYKTLQADYEIEKHDLLDVMHDQSLTEEEIREILQTHEDQNVELGKQMEELLGAENYEIYDTYQERLTERQLVYGLDNTFLTNLGISDEQAQELIDAMYEARNEVEIEYDNDSPGNISTNPDEQMGRQLEIYDAYNESVQGILSESQAEEFEARINEKKELVKMNPFLRGGDDESQ